jgi:hypothetical protein
MEKMLGGKTRIGVLASSRNAIPDLDGMADAALDHLFAALDGEKQACPVALPIADYQVFTGRF